MKIKLIRVAKVICFCIIVIGIVSFLTKLFTPKWLENRWHSAKTNNSFYELEDNSLDIVAMGSSVVAAAIDPYQLYEEYGISAYNLGVMQQSMMGTYFWLEEMFKSQQPKVVIIEVKTAGRVSDKNEADARKSYEYMRWGTTKLQYAVEYCDDNEEADLFEYLFPLGKYHTRWAEISEEDYDFVGGNNKSFTRGFATLTSESQVEYSGIKTDSERVVEYNKTNTKYLKNMIELCQEKKVGIVLVRTPDSSWKASKYNYVKKIANEYGADYIDFNDESLMRQLKFNYASDAADKVHLNLRGAKKITSYLGEYLVNKYELTDYRTSDADVQEELKMGYKTYKDVYEDAELCMENNLDKYLEKINKDKYTFVIANGCDFTGIFSENQLSLLNQAGISEEIFKKCDGETNVIGIVREEEIFLSKKITEEMLSFSKEGYFESDKFYSVTSAYGRCKIKIGTKDYAANPKAVCMVIYDNITGQVADSIYFRTDINGTVTLAR